MSQQQSSVIAETWQQWEGRVVNGRYPLGQYLGGSGESAVYLTKNGDTKAAIKVIPADANEVQQQLQRWELAGRLSHPHLVHILDVGRWHADDEQDMLFAVMEYADENLAETRRALTAAETQQMLEPTLDALRYLHAQGLVHGRLRPANVMAVREQLKLSSDSVRRMGKSDAPLGIPTVYDAPERANGMLAPSGDVWSLGILLVQALTNRVPENDGKNGLKVPENLPAPFDEIVTHCLNIDPERRWSAAEIKKRLERTASEPQPKAVEASAYSSAAEGKKLDALRRQKSVTSAVAATSKRPDDSSTASARPAANKRLLLAAVALAVVLLVVLLGVRMVKRGTETQPATTAATVANVPPTNNGTNTAITPSPATDGKAAVLHEVIPSVPSRARNSISGTVKVKVKVSVDASGKVSHATLAARGPSAYFAQQAQQAARQWSFIAPQVHGQPAGSEWAITFEFRKSGTKASAHRVS